MLCIPILLLAIQVVNGQEELLLAAIGDDFVSGYGAKELGASSRGLNFLTGADSSHSLHHLLSNQSLLVLGGSKQSRLVLGGARGIRPALKCRTSNNTHYFCPANDLLELEADDWQAHKGTDGLTLALEGMGIDSLGRALKIIRTRLRPLQQRHPNATTWLFVHLGINDVCQRACTDWSLADNFISKVRKSFHPQGPKVCEYVRVVGPVPSSLPPGPPRLAPLVSQFPFQDQKGKEPERKDSGRIVL